MKHISRYLHVMKIHWGISMVLKNICIIHSWETEWHCKKNETQNLETRLAIDYIFCMKFNISTLNLKKSKFTTISLSPTRRLFLSWLQNDLFGWHYFLTKSNGIFRRMQISEIFTYHNWWMRIFRSWEHHRCYWWS